MSLTPLPLLVLPALCLLFVVGCDTEVEGSHSGDFDWLNVDNDQGDPTTLAPCAVDDDDTISEGDLIGVDNSLGDDVSAGIGLVDVVAQGIKMIALDSGTFEMGTTPGLSKEGHEDLLVHSVTLTNDFLISETEVTQGQWQALIGNNPATFFVYGGCGAATCPVDWVNWYEALTFANAVSSAEGLVECYTLSGCSGTAGVDLYCTGVTVTSTSGSVYDCVGYRLPTEAEWEYAARAGAGLRYAGSNTAGDVGWFPNAWGLYDGRITTCPVALKAPNAWGLYDMSGNVWEWTWDWWDPEYYSSSPAANPAGPNSGTFRVYRGGGVGGFRQTISVAYRAYDYPALHMGVLGFRLARTIP